MKTMCAMCDKNDGMCYTSLPPKYKCTLDDTFHYGDDSCDLYNRGFKSGQLNILDNILTSFCQHCNQAACEGGLVGSIQECSTIRMLRDTVDDIRRECK